MCNLKDEFNKKKFGLHLPKTMINGCAKVFMKKFKERNTADKIIYPIDTEGLQIMDLYIMTDLKNKGVYMVGKSNTAMKL